jgi:quinol monooxygenase YgiN
MATQEVRFNVSFTIPAENLVQFKAVAQAMIASTQTEAGTLGYDFFYSPDGSRCRLIETYVDSDAVLAHMTGYAVRELVPKIAAIASMTGFEVYGDPGPEAAKILAGLGAEIFSHHAGLSR